MKNLLTKYLMILMILTALLTGCAEEVNLDSAKEQQTEESCETEAQDTENPINDFEVEVVEGEEYTSKDEVAAYIYTYGELPDNFITKKEAKELGWVSKEGNLNDVAPGMSIGGDYFGNYEGILPDDVEYRECDIDFDGDYRGSKRIVYSEDCEQIYYTDDHYETFELLYGDE